MLAPFAFELLFCIGIIKMTPEEACNYPIDLQNHYGYIYCLTFPNGKKYIGQSKRRWKFRWRNHKNKKSGCHALRQAIKKYGVFDLQWQLVCYAQSTKQLTEKQLFYIKTFNTLSPNGYNIAVPGNAYANPQIKTDRIKFGLALNYLRKKYKDKDITQEDVERYLIQKKEKQKNKVKKGTTEWIQQCKKVAKLRQEKLRKEGKTRKNTNRKNINNLFWCKNSKRIKVYQTKEEFDSVVQFCRKYNVPTSSATNCLHKINKSVHGLHIYFSDITDEELQDYIKFWNQTNNRTETCVICIETGKIYKNARQVANEFSINRKKVYDTIRFSTRTINGFHFKYVE